MDNEQRTSNSNDLTSSSQTLPISTLRTEAGSEASRLRVGPVSMTDFLRITFQRQFENVVENASQAISPNAQIGVSAKLQSVPTGDGVELEMYEPLKEALNKMCSSLWTENPPIEFEVVNHSQDTKDPGTPDLVVLSKGKDSSWPCALAFVEVKPNDRQDPFYNTTDESRPDTPHEYQTGVWDQFSYYATVSFKRRPRCFLCGIGIFGSRARFFRWDRSSVLISDYFDYKQDLEPFWQFLAGFGAQGYCGSGVDPTINFESRPDGHVELLREKIKKARAKRLISEEAEMLDDNTLVAQSSTIMVPSKSDDKVEQYITVGPPLFTSTAMLGRGTCTWLAFPVPGTVENPERSNEDHFVIIKDSWRDPSRRLEGEIYKIIHAGGPVPGVARLRSDVDLIDPPDSNSEMHRTIASLLNKHYEPRKCPPRIHHRCILDSVGIPLSRFSSTRQVLEAYYDSLLGHESMGEKKILHRDISVNNIMISAYPDMEKCRGFLIDMEYATVVGEPGSDGELREITGTTQFLSTARVRRPTSDKKVPAHETWNDLESFFWSLVYTFTHYRPNTLPDISIKEIFVDVNPHARTTFAQAYFTDMRVLRGPGRGTEVSRNEGDRTEDLSEDSFNAPVTNCIHELSRLVASHYLAPWVREAFLVTDPEKVCKLETHRYIKLVFRDALDSQSWPNPDDSATTFRLIPRSKKRALDATAENLRTGTGSRPASGSKSKRKREGNDGKDNSAKRARNREAGDAATESAVTEGAATQGAVLEASGVHASAGGKIQDRLPAILD